MKRSAAFFPIVLGAIILAPPAGAQAQSAREEGPIEIEKCQTISQPGSYKLVNNLSFRSSDGTCLTITASFVTIDLAGFTITGASGVNPFNQATAIGAGNDVNGSAVRNGSISFIGTGVSLSGAGSIVEGLRVFRAGLAGIIATGVIKNNTVVETFFPGTGIVASGIISGNYLSDNRETGMEIGQGSTVIGNTVTNSQGFHGPGIRVACPSNVSNNTAVNNVGQNLEMDGNGCTDTNNVAP
jgi:hypothetical protein